MKEKINNELSEYLKYLRFKNKLSQENVAEKLGITRQAYSLWENNPIKLDLGQLFEVGNAMNENILIFFENYIANCNEMQEKN
jgi:transcriptional regulator with XRE-family HTH domain